VLGALPDIQWGDLATWFLSLISSFALIAAVIAGRYTAKAYRAQVDRDDRDNEDRLEQEHLRLREQAALVSTWIEYPINRPDGTVALAARVRNGSQTPVYQAQLTIVNIHNADQTVERSIPVIPPANEPQMFEYPAPDQNDVPEDSLAFRAELSFTDSVGNRWSRDLQGRLVNLEERLRVWADELRTPVLARFASQFAEPLGVRVESREVLLGDIQPSLTTAGQPGQPPVPDLVVGAHDWIGNLAARRVLDPIPLTERRRTAFVPLAIDAMTYQGVGYGIPYAMENVALFRNTTLVPNPPASFEELVEIGIALRSRGAVSTVLSVPIGATGNAYHFHPLFTAAGGPPLPVGADPGELDPSQPADLGFASPQSLAAFQRIAELGERGTRVLSTKAPSEIAVFARGDAPFLITGPWALAEINKSKVPYAISPIPAFAGLGPARPLVGVAALFIPRGGANRHVAHDFLLNYLTRTDLAMALFAAEPRPPALNLALERLAGDPVITAFAAAGADGVPMPSWPETRDLYGLIGQAEAEVIRGAKVEDKVAGLAREVADLMSRGSRLPRQRGGDSQVPVA
jgi:arabinogalactan oligomer/maltooligosaccharide transport system substrate-binding protein